MSPTGLFPRETLRPTASRAEKALYDALQKHLPPNWTAWHSMKVRVPRGREAEGDFVIAIPDRGLIALEVKGGRIEVRDGQWIQNGRVLAKVPRDQGHGFKRALLEQLRHRYPRRPLPYVTLATAFPDTAWDSPPTHGDIDGAILGQQDLPFLNHALLALAERLFRDQRTPDWDWISALHELWGESWVPSLSLGSRTNLREAQLVELDARQRNLLAKIDVNPRLYVAGRPGTGKTLLAMELARRWKASGKRPLLLCHTRALASSLQRAGHEASTVRELAADILEAAGVVIENGAPRADWSQPTWNRVSQEAAKIVASGPFAHDAIVIDEAQDLDESDWELMRAVIGNEPLWVFGDEGQAFWKDRREIPADMRPFVYLLDETYRCPKRLADFADRYRPEARAETEAAEPPRPFEELSVLQVPSDSVEHGCAVEIEKLVAEGVKLEQIAVLSLAGQTKTVLGNASRIGRFEVARADDEDAGEKLVADTFLRFKGLERPWIVVTELGLATTNYEIRMHIALTRATVGCIVVATADEIENDRKLRMVAGIASD